MPTTSLMAVEGDAEVDTFVEEIIQYAIKDSFFFFKHCVNATLNGRSFASIANLLNHYIAGIKSIDREEKAAPYKAIVAQL